MDGVALVTGGGGFVGANLVRRLLNDGLEVHVMLHGDEPPWRLVDLEALIRHRVSIADAEAVGSVVADVRPDWIFHLAAHGAYSHQTARARMVSVNTLGTINLLAAVARVGCRGFVHTGSSSEYGFKDHAPTEDEPVAPASVYAITKCAATHAVSCWARENDLPSTTVRLYSVYGPWEDPSRLVPRLLVAAAAGTLPPLTDAATARDFVWVEDAVDAIIQAANNSADHPGAVWNIGSGIQTTLHEIVEITCSTFGIRAEPDWNSMAPRIWDTTCWVSDPSRAHADLGWEARTSVESGLRATARWLVDSPARSRYER